MVQFTEIRRSFDRAAGEYEKAAVVQNEIGQRLLERLDFIKINPQRVLDLGCGAGQFSLALKKRYPKAQIVAIDISKKMLQQAGNKQTWRKKWSLIQADMANLPFQPGSFDLIFSNQTIHWSDNAQSLFAELQRVMATDGCLLFSTLGPDTFKELKAIFNQIDTFAHVNQFDDMHNIGDRLLQQQFMNPVMDMEFLTVCYPSVKKLLNSLKKQGVRNIHPNRKRGLSSQRFVDRLIGQYQEQYGQDQKIPLTYEVVYGHAWRGVSPQQTIGVETYVPISQIQRK